MASESQKDKLLFQAKNLRTTTQPRFNGIFIHQDLTPLQRQMRHKLVLEHKERQKKGEKLNSGKRQDSHKKREAGKCSVTGESEKSSGFNCMYTNANSILDKMEEFRERVIAGHFDIIGITETWASQDILDTGLTLDGHTLYRNDRLGRVRGGMALYIKVTLQVTLKSDLNNSDFQESIWCEVYSDRAAILVGVIYRCPSSAAINNGNLLKLISTAAQQCRKKILLIMGDFNYPEIKCQDCYVQAGPGSEPAVFYWLVEDSFLTHHITEPIKMNEDDNHQPWITY